MESLYVCLFSNGHIKVGRSIDPESRIATHADRVSCLGVELVDSFSVACVGPAYRAESVLIALCNEKANRKNKSEWFEGLDFADVVEMARGCAAMQIESAKALASIDYDKPDFALILAHLKAAGHTQIAVAGACGIRQPSISDIASGKTQDPSYSVGAALIRLAKSSLPD